DSHLVMRRLATLGRFKNAEPKGVDLNFVRYYRTTQFHLRKVHADRSSCAYEKVRKHHTPTIPSTTRSIVCVWESADKEKVITEVSGSAAKQATGLICCSC